MDEMARCSTKTITQLNILNKSGHIKMATYVTCNQTPKCKPRPQFFGYK